jgi:hypothetical protein
VVWSPHHPTSIGYAKVATLPFGAFDGPLENAELMAEREDLELQRRPAPEGSENSGQKSGQ